MELLLKLAELLTSYSATTKFRQLIKTDGTIEFRSGWRLCSINEIASAENCIPKLLNRDPALVPAHSNSIGYWTVLAEGKLNTGRLSTTTVQRPPGILESLLLSVLRIDLLISQHTVALLSCEAFCLS